MRINHQWRKSNPKSPEAGQVMAFLLVALGLFLLGAVAFSVDMGNLWFHRQTSQNAADAACIAGAMDLFVDSQGGATGNQGFDPSKGDFDCTSGSTASPCQYAAFNGYNSANTTPGNLVHISFPGAVTGVTAPGAGLAPVPYMRVDVTDRIPAYFSGLLSGNTTQTVGAYAVCGAVLQKAPIPILVLNPTVTKALDIQGTPNIGIFGGASQSIQVNSSSSTAINLGGSAKIDLCYGGTTFCGANLGVYGNEGIQGGFITSCPPATPPPNAPSCQATQVTPKWITPTSPILDPFANIVAPTCTTCLPAVPADLDATNSANDKGNLCTSTDIQNGNCFVSHNTHGCPDPGATSPPTKKNGCELFTAGYYPSGITLDNSGGVNPVGIFDPGVYYLKGGLGLKSGSMVRPGTGTGDGSQGTVFYFTGSAQTCSGQTGLVCVGSNSGKAGLDSFDTTRVKCSAGPALDPNLKIPATLDGNVLMAPCTGTYGDPSGKYRGILFFEDRRTSTGGGWGGGGGFLLAGSMYFHQCTVGGLSDTGQSCDYTTPAFNSNFSLQGNSGSASYVLGEIITDTLSMGGTPTINMVLNPNATLSTLKVSLLPTPH
jgi:hypothetical protein